MPHVVTHSWPAMGSAFDAVLLGGDAGHLRAVAAAVEEEVARLAVALSRFDPAGEVFRLNRDAAAGPVRVDADLWELLARCEAGRAATDGFFDVAVGSDPGTHPPRLLLDPDRRAVRFAGPGVRVDLGGVGKGFALDRAAELVRRFGVSRALLSAGTSSVVAVGGPWPVDLRNPADPDGPPAGRAELSDAALSCSAVRHPGQPVSDLRDPATGEPLAGCAAVVVVAANGTGAEILSTALLAMGRGRAVGYLERTPSPGVRVGWLDPAPVEWLTSG